MVRDLGDVQQAVGARHDLDERAEIGDALHLAHVGLVQLRRGGQLLDDADRLRRRLAVGGRHVHAAIVLDVDLHAGPLDDAPDHLAAGANDVANLVDRDLDGDDPRREVRHGRPGCAERLGHLAEDVHPSCASLVERLRHDLGVDPRDLDVHLQGGDALRGAGDLEVHVAVVILGARDVREDGVLAGLLVHDEPHRDAGDGCLDRHARVHHRHRTAAHRCHRRGSVRFENVRDETNRVGELVVARDHRRQRALRKRAVADLAAPGAGEAAGLAHRERREVVVEHEALVELAAHVLDLLFVVRGAERAGDERLRLAAREDDRAVHTRQDAGLRPDRTDLIELAAVEPMALVEDLVAQHLLLHLVEDVLGLGVLFLVERVEQVVEDGIDPAVAFELVENPHRVAERSERLVVNRLVERLVYFLGRDRQLLLADRRLQLVDRGDELLDGRVRRFERADHFLLGDFPGAGLDHQDAVGAAGDDEIQRALLALAIGRIDDDAAVHDADADAGDRLLERDLRQRERGGCAGNRQHVGVVVLVGRQQQRDDLRFVAPAGREERTARPIDEAAGQHLLLGRLAFALEEPARDAARGVGVFAVINRERKEVDPFARVSRVAGGHKDDGVARSDDHRPVGLLGQLAGFNGDAA